MNKFITFLKTTGAGIALIAIIPISLILIVLFYGVAIRLYTSYLGPFLEYADGLAFILSFVFLFLCIFRKCRIFCGTALVVCSYVIGIDVWFQSLVNTYVSFGAVGIIIGILFLGVGVYITGLAALLWAHMFASFFGFLFVLVFMIGIRSAGQAFAQNESARRYEISLFGDEENIAELAE